MHQAVQLEDAQRHLVLGSGYSRVQVRGPNGKPGASDYLWLHFRVVTREGRYRVGLSQLGAVYNFSALSQGFPAISTYMTPEQVAQLKAGLDESVQRLLMSLRKTVTAPVAAW